MIFQTLVLNLLATFNGERTVSAVYHLLRGKRSGQTIQDVGIFGLHSYFGILPKLQRRQFDEQINNLSNQHYISILPENRYRITETGYSFLKQSMKLSFDGWHYRGNEHIFFARLSLIVQTLSYLSDGNMKFIPIQQNDDIQLWVKSYLKTQQYQNGHLQQKLLNEIVASLEKVKNEEREKSIVIKRLSGVNQPGFTWQQISIHEKLTEMDVQLLYISCIHHWLNEITFSEENYPLLSKIAERVRIEMTLTESANQTAQLFKKGYSIDEISMIRNLKTSTIEDHIVELAMNDRKFPIVKFLTEEETNSVLRTIDDYQTKKLKVLHEVLPNLSYFQLRLVLARGDSNSWN
ncbi:helix-turn-helix domain-containing protein [Ureibacillus manganicus]|uniref:ATP-dependent DNA helicase RecQ n=1 Tax=Ureibacillus manganicus DSM 26584 TaxID=1384049 RepID=A0A0A3I9V8_9BACL|nr:helix-turn-helix domain-containing protein [Ureibacillus manganicus]KGR79578.1 ATP-dependent DNA helicase RecQ [Ureibacillus manganicus DSM 26584]